MRVAIRNLAFSCRITNRLKSVLMLHNFKLRRSIPLLARIFWGEGLPILNSAQGVISKGQAGIYNQTRLGLVLKHCSTIGAKALSFDFLVII